MTAAQHYLSKEKFAELEAEFEHLKTTGREEIAAALEYAKSLGDLSENAEYHEARETQAKTEDRILTLERILKDMVIVEDKKGGVTVALGSTILISKTGEKSPQRYHLVGSEEANIAEFKISNESPLGRNLIGKKKGESVTIETPRGKTIYTINEIE